MFRVGNCRKDYALFCPWRIILAQVSRLCESEATMKKVFIFGYKVKPKPNNPDYLKVSYGMGGVWISGHDAGICKEWARQVVTVQGWEIIAEEAEQEVSAERLSAGGLEKYRRALIEPQFYVVKVGPGETQRPESN